MRLATGFLCIASIAFLIACGDDDSSSSDTGRADADVTETADDTSEDTADDSSADTTEETAAETSEDTADTDDTSTGGTPLIIGTLVPATGPLAFLGTSGAASIQLAVNDINAAGGVQQHPVEKIDGDSRTDPDFASQEATRLLEGGAQVIIGAWSSSTTAGVIDQITDAGVVQISPANTANFLTDWEDHGLYFRLAPPDTFNGAVLAELIKSDGHDSLAIIAIDNGYGEGLSAALSEHFAAIGGTVSATVTHDFPESFADHVATLAAATPEAIVVIGFDETLEIIPEMIAQGVGPAEVGVYFVDGNAGPFGDDFPPGTLDGVRGVIPGVLPDEAFAARLLEVDEDATEPFYAAEAYDAVILAALAAEAAGSTTGVDLAAELVGVSKDGVACSDFATCAALIADGEDIDYEGQSGSITFDDRGDPTDAIFTVFEYDETNFWSPVGQRTLGDNEPQPARARVGVVLLPDDEGAFWDELQAHIEEVATELGVELAVARAGPAAEQIAAIEGFGPVDALLMRPGGQTTCEHLAETLSTPIPVVQIDSAQIDAASCPVVVGSVTTDNNALGAAAGAVLADLGDETDAWVLTLPAEWGIDSVNARVDGATVTLTERGLNTTAFALVVEYFFNQEAGDYCEFSRNVHEVRAALVEGAGVVSTFAGANEAFQNCVLNDCALETECTPSDNRDCVCEHDTTLTAADVSVQSWVGTDMTPAVCAGAMDAVLLQDLRGMAARSFDVLLGALDDPDWAEAEPQHVQLPGLVVSPDEVCDSD